MTATGGAHLHRLSGEFLLRLCEQTTTRTVAAVLDELDTHCSKELLDTGLLFSNGPSAIAVEAGDDGVAFKDATWTGSGYGYFSTSDGGIVEVDPAESSTLALNHWIWLRVIADQLKLTNASQPTALVPDHAWDLGDIWVSKNRKVPVLFARRLHRSEVATSLETVLDNRGDRGSCLILTSTRQPHQFSRCSVVSLNEALTNNADRFVLDRSLVLAAYAVAPDVPHRQPLYLSPDERLLVINGSVEISLRSAIQTKLIRALVAAYGKGIKVPAGRLLAEAGSGATSFKKAFGTAKWSQLSPYLKSHQGLWGFEP